MSDLKQGVDGEHPCEHLQSPEQLQCAVFCPTTIRKCFWSPGLEKSPLTLPPFGVISTLRENSGENAGNTASNNRGCFGTKIWSAPTEHKALQHSPLLHNTTVTMLGDKHKVESGLPELPK